MSEKESNSSFENGKEYAEAWKKYLSEKVNEEEVPSAVDEGFLDNLKTGVRAGAQAYKGAKVAAREKGRDLKRASGAEVGSITKNLVGQGEKDKQDPTAQTAPASQPAAAQQGQPGPSRSLKISVSDRYGDATSVEKMAMQLLGMPKLPDPNKDKQQNRALQKLTAQLAQLIKNALKQKYGNQIGSVAINESNIESLQEEVAAKILRGINEKARTKKIN
jgi:hypothetical protein